MKKILMLMLLLGFSTNLFAGNKSAEEIEEERMYALESMVFSDEGISDEEKMEYLEIKRKYTFYRYVLGIILFTILISPLLFLIGRLTF